MATISTAASGNWNATGTWAGGVIPVAGDVVVFAGAHTVTVPVGYTAEVGNAAAPTTACITNSGQTGSVLVVNGTLRIRSNVQQDRSTWRVNGGGIIEAPNATSAITWTCDGSALEFVGTSAANRAIMRKGTGSAGLRLTGPQGAGGSWNNRLYARWALFQGLGDSTLFGLNVEEAFGTGSPGGLSFIGLDMADTVVDGCGRVGAANTNMSATTPLTLQRVRFKNCLGAVAYYQDGSSTASGAARLFEDVAADKPIRFGPPGATFTRVIIDSGTSEPIQSFAQWAAFTDCMLVDATSTGAPASVYGSITRGLRVRNNAGGNNWHGIQVSSAAGTTPTIDGLLFDGTVGEALGDLIIGAGSSGAGTVLTVKNVLATKGPAASGGYGKLISLLGNANLTVVVEHCTAFSGTGSESALLGVGETYVGHTGMVSSAKSNLSVGLSAGVGSLISRQGSGLDTVNIVTPAGVTNNAVRNAVSAATGTGGGNKTIAGGTQPMFSSIPAAPLDVDPQFVDDTRNLATWYRSVVGGTPGTRAADTALAIAALMDAVETPVAGITITAAYDWIRAGYAPTNTALQAAHDGVNGGWIGAVAGSVTAPAPTVPNIHEQYVAQLRAAGLIS